MSDKNSTDSEGKENLEPMMHTEVYNKLRSIPQGMIPCLLCGTLVKLGATHCGVITAFDIHPMQYSLAHELED